MRKLVSYGLVGLGVLAIGWTVGSVAIVAGIEEARYTVTAQRDGYEIRRYEPQLVAEAAMPTQSSADRGAAFRLIAGYIFGGNEGKASIAMTAPVVMGAPGKSEPIAMTAPVIMGAGTMRFVMPSKYKSLADLPKPNDARVVLKEVPGKTVAAVRFSWYPTEVKVAALSDTLLAALARDGQKAASKPYLASYDPPFSVPFLKRNDILVDLETPVPSADQPARSPS
jgi:hypothetical protein